VTVSNIAEDFVQRVTIRRKEMGVSQGELARRMKAQGYPWYQMTIARTETGERPLRLDEALTLAEVLAMPMPLSDESLAAELADAHGRIAALVAEAEDLRARCERQAAALQCAEATVARVAEITSAHLRTPGVENRATAGGAV
jgi:transcriptional regulator with XRE-family HTH domain